MSRRDSNCQSDKKRTSKVIEFAFWIILCIVILLLFGYVSRSMAEETETLSPVQHILTDYGQADDESIHALNEHYEAFPSLNYSDEKLSAQIQEIVYDGVWSYITTKVNPADDTDIMILPAGAYATDQVMIPLLDEEGTYLELAQNNRCQLLAVYCYPKEYDEKGEYFFDYYQDENGAFFLLSGCKMNSNTRQENMTPVLQIYNVDLTTMKYALVGYKEWNTLETEPFVPVVDYDYQVTDNTWINKVTLRKTGITTYLIIDWKSTEATQNIYFFPQDQDGWNWPNGYSLDTDAYYLKEIPECFTIQIRGEEETEITAEIQKGAGE